MQKALHTKLKIDRISSLKGPTSWKIELKKLVTRTSSRPWDPVMLIKCVALVNGIANGGTVCYPRFGQLIFTVTTTKFFLLIPSQASLLKTTI